MGRDFSDLTVVNVDGRAGDHSRAAMSLSISQQALPGARGLLLCPDRPSNLSEGISHVSVAPMDYVGYSNFMLYRLHEYVETDWCLIVQEDGWVLDGANWQAEFRNYDYIGAPTHAAQVVFPDRAPEVFRGFAWTRFLGTSCLIRCILNGGFSLRSKRLLAMPTNRGITSSISHGGASQPQGTLDVTAQNDLLLEDAQICVHMRPRLEALGLRFPPIEVSRLFSVEHLCPDLHEGFDLDSVFGHHSKLRKLAAIDPLTMHFQLRENDLPLVAGEDRIRDLFARRGYRIEYVGRAAL